MAEWYYTSNKQQMGPVSHEELRQLAVRGLLKPTDLVWRDGMKDWVRASTQGLFADDKGSPTASPIPASKRVASIGDVLAGDSPSRDAPTEDETEERPRPRRARREEIEDEEDDLDDRPRRKRRAPREGGMPVGLKVGLIVGGIVVLLIAVGVGLYFLLRGGGDGAPAVAVFPQVINANLTPTDVRDPRMRNPSKVYNFQFRAGKTYTIQMVSAAMDSILRLEESNGNQLAIDDDGMGFPNAQIIFVCQRTANYRVIATNLNNRTGPFTLTVNER